MYYFLIVLKIFALMMVFSPFAYASSNCFIAKEDGKVVKQIGACDIRHSPFSTFKIPLAVMGFDSGILISSNDPEVKFTTEIDKAYVTYYNPNKYPTMLLWKRDQTPQSWIRNSTVWYSRYITHKLGIAKLQHYLDEFAYGNKNISHCTEKCNNYNGLMDAWLGNSLKISPSEQVEFLEKLATKTLHVTQDAQEKAVKLIKMETIYDDFQLYGKTGGGMDSGWFIGWAEKANKRIIFAQYIEQKEDSLITAGKMAKEMAKDNLITLLIK